MPLVTLSFVPPGGGEQDYTMEVDLPGIPRAGDTISVSRGGGQGHSGFIVRSVRWNITANPFPHPGVSVGECWVFAEFADSGDLDGESHQRCIKMYASRGKPAKKLPEDGW